MPPQGAACGDAESRIMNGLMPEIHLARPRNVAEAVAARRQHAGSRFIAGGSDLIVNMRHGLSNPDLLIDLSGIDELAGIEAGPLGLRIVKNFVDL